MHIDEPKLSENYFIRFWNFFAGIAFNVAPVKADFVKQEDIVAHFLQRGHQNAEDLVRSILKSRQYGSEIEIVQFYCLYPLMHDTMCGKRRKTTVSVWSEEGEIDMLRLVFKSSFLQAINYTRLKMGWKLVKSLHVAFQSQG